MAGSRLVLASVHLINDLPKFVTRKAHELLLYGWITGLRFNFPNMTIEGCIQNFQLFYPWAAKNYKKKTLEKVYERMNKEDLDMRKSRIKDVKNQKSKSAPLDNTATQSVLPHSVRTQPQVHDGKASAGA